MSNKGLNLKKALGIGALVLALGTSVVGCGLLEGKNKPHFRIILDIKANETYRFWGGSSITYNGMTWKESFPGRERIFSITQGPFSFSKDASYVEMKGTYSSDAKEVDFYNKTLKVIAVTPEHLILERLE